MKSLRKYTRQNEHADEGMLTFASLQKGSPEFVVDNTINPIIGTSHIEAPRWNT